MSHTKVKTIKEQGETEEMSYQILGSNLSEDIFNIFQHKADVVGTVAIEKSIDSDNKRLNSVETNLYFRGTNFIIAGSRFSNIVEKIPFNASNFITAIEDAIKNSATTTKITDDNFQALASQEKAEREAMLSVQEVAVTEEIVEDKKAILASIKSSFMKADASQKAKIKELLTNAGASKLDETIEISVLKEMESVLA